MNLGLNMDDPTLLFLIGARLGLGRHGVLPLSRRSEGFYPAAQSLYEIGPERCGSKTGAAAA